MLSWPGNTALGLHPPPTAPSCSSATPAPATSTPSTGKSRKDRRGRGGCDLSRRVHSIGRSGVLPTQGLKLLAFSYSALITTRCVLRPFAPELPHRKFRIVGKGFVSLAERRSSVGFPGSLKTTPSITLLARKVGEY